MRRVFIAGNWKMNLDRSRAIALATAIRDGADAAAEIAVCPPFVYLPSVAEVLAGSAVALAAQNMYHEQEGPFTGEISGGMLRDVGCDFVILGHSERRQLLHESDAVVNTKLKVALEAGLKPIVCVGETLEQREAWQTTEVVTRQFDGSFAGIAPEQMGQIVMAYEPVWAIGTGRVATPEQAEAVHVALRKHVAKRYNAEIADQIRIQYGGSVKPTNAADLLAQPNIDGALVGGAALQADDFLTIISHAG